MNALVLLLALGASPVDTGPTDRVDLCELNHYFDENGAHLLDQFIFQDWDAAESRYNVRGWRLMKRPGQFPKEVHGGYVVDLGGCSGKVVATKFIESWTQWDPELHARRHLPREQRVDVLQKDDPLPPAPEVMP